MNNVDTELMYQDKPVCPYCGIKQSNAEEWMEHDLNASGDYECGECGETFHCYRDVTVDYSTSKIEKEQHENK